MKKTRIITALSRLISNRLLQHLFFWVFSYFVLVNFFRISDEIGKVDYIYTAIFLATLMIAVYINLVILIPHLLELKRYLYYLLSVLALLFFASVFNDFVYGYLIDLILPDYYFISYYSLIDIGKFFVIFIGLTFLIKLSKDWFHLIDSKQKISEIEKEKAEIELKALRAQVNPHFLFNSLNVLYLLALNKSDESPDAIIKLSDILRYVIYESNKDLVSLSSEVKLINDYLALQNFRIDDTSKIEFNIRLDKDNSITPMLLLPLVENSFKHGVKGDLADTFVKIQLISDEKETFFRIENNRGDPEETENNKDRGVGLGNIRHRLELIYPGNHNFDIVSNERSFKVTLRIYHEN